jgi:hypothetical protein
MLIIDDFFPKEVQDLLEKTLIEYPFYYKEDTVSFEFQKTLPFYNRLKPKSHISQLQHTLFEEYEKKSDAFDTIYKAFDDFGIKKIVEQYSKLEFKLYRMKINLLLARNERCHHVPHCDWTINKNCVSMIYYISESDGDTFLFNEFYQDNPKKLSIYKKIPPKKGRILAFESNRYHASSSPQKFNKRFAINIVMGNNYS